MCIPGFHFITSYRTLIVAWLGDTGSGPPFVIARGWFVVNHKSGVARGERLDLVGQYRWSLPYVVLLINMLHFPNHLKPLEKVKHCVNLLGSSVGFSNNESTIYQFDYVEVSCSCRSYMFAHQSHR